MFQITKNMLNEVNADQFAIPPDRIALRRKIGHGTVEEHVKWFGYKLVPGEEYIVVIDKEWKYKVTSNQMLVDGNGQTFEAGTSMEYGGLTLTFVKDPMWGIVFTMNGVKVMPHITGLQCNLHAFSLGTSGMLCLPPDTLVKIWRPLLDPLELTLKSGEWQIMQL